MGGGHKAHPGGYQIPGAGGVSPATTFQIFSEQRGKSMIPNSIGTIIIQYTRDTHDSDVMFIFRTANCAKGICVYQRERNSGRILNTRIYDSVISDEEAQMLGANANAICKTLLRMNTQFEMCFADFESDPFDPSIMTNYREESEETEE